jgi:hypothetical protein
MESPKDLRFSSHVTVRWQAAMLFTVYFTVSLKGHFIILKSDQMSFLTFGLLPSKFTVLYYMLNAQLFLRPQRVTQWLANQ